MPELSIHIHEDDWGMRNLHPIAALAEAADDAAEAAAAGERNRAPDGVGWTKVHVIQPPSLDYTATGLRLVIVAAALAPLLPPVRKFAATACAGFDPGVHDNYGSYENDASCFGFNSSCFIKLETDGELISRIWFECNTDNAAHAASLGRAILAVNAVAPSAIADYWNDMSGAVSDTEFLDRYFAEIMKRAE